ncbi:hypothetical protein H920_08836 [Fukomys damarensis]|uniref:Uncharacterized protein n=1 Tax=Fukomys damarensis TaxID=885580 RepID=A0A091E3Q6_FUKDA|nr:hypothetical protein H920_08836 [Fukomys damarensis]
MEDTCGHADSRVLGYRSDFWQAVIHVKGPPNESVILICLKLFMKAEYLLAEMDVGSLSELRMDSDVVAHDKWHPNRDLSKRDIEESALRSRALQQEPRLIPAAPAGDLQSTSAVASVHVSGVHSKLVPSDVLEQSLGCDLGQDHICGQRTPSLWVTECDELVFCALSFILNSRAVWH